MGAAQDFLPHVVVRRSEFGWRNHAVGELDGVVVAARAGYSGAIKWAFTLAATQQILTRCD